MAKANAKHTGMPVGPTHNRSYNELLIRWAAKPECEDCECSLKDKPVIETEVGWLCQKCAEEDGYESDCDCRDCVDERHESRCDEIAAARFEVAAHGRGE